MTKLEKLFFRGLIGGMFIFCGVSMQQGNTFFMVVFLVAALFVWDQIYDRMNGDGK